MTHEAKNSEQEHTLSLLYTTLPTKEAAELLAHQVIFQKLAACANIMSSGLSVYAWEGKIEQNEECFVLFKTTQEKLSELATFVRSHHAYKTPALLIWDVQTSTNFGDYVKQAVHSM